MKLPFQFSLKFAFRILLPGFVIALAMLPTLQAILYSLNIDFSEYSYFVISAATIIFGWLIVILDMQIYMIYEGRRYWPKSIRKLFLHLQKRRLEKLLQQLEEYENIDRHRYLEVSVDIRRSPIDTEGNFHVLCPTRIGNLIYSYEEYPLRTYGMDSVFYWHRIWLLIDNDVREEVDNQQALADSAIYTSFALFCSSIICIMYAFLKKLNVKIIINYLPNITELLALAISCYLIGYFIYRISLSFHEGFGHIFKSLFDIYQTQVSSVVDNVMEHLSILFKDEKILNDLNLSNQTPREKYKIAWRFMHNYRYKTKDGAVLTIPKLISIEKNKKKINS